MQRQPARTPGRSLRRQSRIQRWMCPAARFASKSKIVRKSRGEWLAADTKDDPTTGDMIEILYRYQFFIAAKVHRAFHGILDFDGDDDPDELSDPQSDANGSAKVALIAVERSILAWTYLLSPNNAADIRPIIELLETVKSKMEQKFPNARDFVRPGFDEIETVM